MGLNGECGVSAQRHLPVQISGEGLKAVIGENEAILSLSSIAHRAASTKSFR